MLHFLESLPNNERWTTILSYLILSLMIICFIFSLVQFVDALFLEWEGGYLVFLGLLVALEAFYTQRLRQNLIILDPEWGLFYLSEFVVFLLVLKVFQLFSHGSAGFLEQLDAMRLNFTGGFFNHEYLINLCLILIVWYVSVSFAAPIDALRVDQRRLRLEEEVGLGAERAAARRRLVDQMLALGLVMVFLASLLHFEPASGWFQERATRLGVIAAMVYFVLGLVLLSLTQFTLLQMRWALNRIPVSRGIAARWAGYSFLFLSLLGAFALFLPTRYTRGVLLVLAWLLNLMIALFAFLSWLVTFLVFSLAVLFANLIGAPPAPEAAPPLAMPTPLPPSEVETILQMPAQLIAILVWTGVLVLMGYLLAYYYRSRRQEVDGLRRIPILAWLSGLWRWLIAWLRAARRQAAQALASGVERLRLKKSLSPLQSPWGYASLRRMTPRQTVIFYYHRLLRRGEQCQVPRHPSQTPYEYAAQLTPDLRLAQEPLEHDLKLMTEQFVEARYSRHEISPEQVGRVRQSWEHLRRALNRLRKSASSRY